MEEGSEGKAFHSPGPRSPRTGTQATSEHVQGDAEVSSRCHRSKEKGTVTRAKSLFVGGLEIFPKKSSDRENAQTIRFIFISIKAFKRYLGRFLKLSP